MEQFTQKRMKIMNWLKRPKRFDNFGHLAAAKLAQGAFRGPQLNSSKLAVSVEVNNEWISTDSLTNLLKNLLL